MSDFDEFDDFPDDLALAALEQIETLEQKPQSISHNTHSAPKAVKPLQSIPAAIFHQKQTAPPFNQQDNFTVDRSVNNEPNYRIVQGSNFDPRKQQPAANSRLEKGQKTLFESLGINKPAVSNPIPKAKPKVLVDSDSDPDEVVGEFIHSVDSEAIKTWIYPTNLPEREYQFHITRTALLHNTLVALPTGLGKTFIAAVVM